MTHFEKVDDYPALRIEPSNGFPEPEDILTGIELTKINNKLVRVEKSAFYFHFAQKPPIMAQELSSIG